MRVRLWGKPACRTGSFNSMVDIMPTIVVETEDDVRKAEEAIGRAASECLISKSLKFKPKVLLKVQSVGSHDKKGDR